MPILQDAAYGISGQSILLGVGGKRPGLRGKFIEPILSTDPHLAGCAHVHGRHQIVTKCARIPWIRTIYFELPSGHIQSVQTRIVRTEPEDPSSGIFSDGDIGLAEATIPIGLEHRESAGLPVKSIEAIISADP